MHESSSSVAAGAAAEGPQSACQALVTGVPYSIHTSFGTRHEAMVSFTTEIDYIKRIKLSFFVKTTCFLGFVHRVVF
jgi:hypothetical protein